MCIIIAKPAGIKMPTSEILSNCFTNNPDGAGIMLSANGKVWGFKGLMTLDSVEFQLKKMQKTFGNLDKLPVVMHFRIATHGSSIAANTHPFPVCASYKAMRRLEWTSDLGMAHNGIISELSTHPDIKAENVSDTMAFIKHVVAPIKGVCNIMKSDKVLNALQITAGSKLAFIDSKGNMKALGNFIVNDGIYYSNSTYNSPRFDYKSFNNWNWYDGWEKWEISKTKKRSDKPRLSQDDERYLRESLAIEYGLFELSEECSIVCEGYEVPCNLNYAIDEGDGTLYYWDDNDYDWLQSTWSDEYINIRIGEELMYDA